MIRMRRGLRSSPLPPPEAAAEPGAAPATGAPQPPTQPPRQQQQQPQQQRATAAVAGGGGVRVPAADADAEDDELVAMQREEEWEAALAAMDELQAGRPPAATAATTAAAATAAAMEVDAEPRPHPGYADLPPDLEEMLQMAEEALHQQPPPPQQQQQRPSGAAPSATLRPAPAAAAAAAAAGGRGAQADEDEELMAMAMEAAQEGQRGSLQEGRCAATAGTVVLPAAVVDPADGGDYDDDEELRQLEAMATADAEAAVAVRQSYGGDAPEERASGAAPMEVEGPAAEGPGVPPGAGEGSAGPLLGREGCRGEEDPQADRTAGCNSTGAVAKMASVPGVGSRGEVVRSVDPHSLQLQASMGSPGAGGRAFVEAADGSTAGRWPDGGESQSQGDAGGLGLMRDILMTQQECDGATQASV
ncbi:hypothetical protein TSOC_002866 [Tetrabaena socialis]|uniref:Uncharacterized protein n=1 Tax=Tetrabaena socialis TaxID=47790 RepID=A0A2J8AD07_9CHLO|nr:hypothetical protein TSOC_002866 [Tetrabaena socialis]|eukprot:PNH10393.1 hypothetical protein TSOC_002866 [Tetrabaena socialis]